MLSGLERKTGWSLAEHAGEAAPGGMQRLFTAARWDEDLVRGDVRGYVASVLGDPDGVLIGDDTGFEKKGSCSAGVQRQYTGTAGKITNCQIGVFLAYAGPKGRALIDRELYLPRSWTADEDRLAGAKIPDKTQFRTKPQLLELMIGRAIAAGIPFAWANYHRWHSPVAGTIVRAFVQAGTYYSEADSEGADAVEPTNSQSYLAHVAARAVILIRGHRTDGVRAGRHGGGFLLRDRLEGDARLPRPEG
jgi:hypothetical protein